RVHLGLHDQAVSEPVRFRRVVRQHPDQPAQGRHDRRDPRGSRARLRLLPLHRGRARHACGRAESRVRAPRRRPGGMDDGARLGYGGGDRRRGRHDDRPRRLSGAEHDDRRAPLRLRRGYSRWRRQSGRGSLRRLPRRHHRESGRAGAVRRQRAQAHGRAGVDRRRSDGAPQRHLRHPRRAEGVMTVGAGPQAVIPPKPVRPPSGLAVAGISLRAWRRFWLVLGIVVALTLPLFAGSFTTFQLTQAAIYAIAILGLNLLTGFNGQFSLGHSAFYAIGAYTAAIMMDQWEIAYYWTLPAAGLICLVVGFLFGLPALRLEGLYLALATFALAVATPQILKFSPLEEWTGGVQGIFILKPDAPPGLPLDQDQWLYYFT